MKRNAKAIYLIMLVFLALGLIACRSETPGNELSTPTVPDKPVVIETPHNPDPPIVRISDNNYSSVNMGSLMGLAEDGALVGRSIPDPGAYIDSAINQAEELKLDSGNLKEILNKLVLHIEHLDFSKGRDLGNGWIATFMLSDKTAQLPYIIEKAKYQGQEAWLIVLNWEMNYEGKLTHGSHIAIVTFKYGTSTVLLAMSCG
jgi:hypothetical protein